MAHDLNHVRLKSVKVSWQASRQAGRLFLGETPLFHHTAFLWEFSQITIIFLKMIKFNVVRLNSVVKICNRHYLL